MKLREPSRLDRGGGEAYTPSVCGYSTGKRPFPDGFSRRGLAPPLWTSLLLLFLLPVAPGYSEPTGDSAAGKALYAKHCASCHGQKGEGLGLLSTLPNFTDAKYMAGKADKDLFDKITLGGRGTGMPAYEKRLSEQERRNVLAYIRTLAHR